jgi:hypothetical protein
LASHNRPLHRDEELARAERGGCLTNTEPYAVELGGAPHGLAPGRWDFSRGCRLGR